MKANRILKVDALVSSGSEGHVSGDAHFSNGHRYRFVSYSGKVTRLMRYRKDKATGYQDYASEYGDDNVPQLLGMQIAEAIRPHVARVVQEARERIAREDAKRKEENRVEWAKLCVQNAAPALLEALKAALERLNVANQARTPEQGTFAVDDIERAIALAEKGEA